MLDAKISVGSYKIKVKVILAILFFIWIIFGNTFSSCRIRDGFTNEEKEKEKEKEKKEGFEERKDKKEGFTDSRILDIFYNIKFDPECCPNAYTSSSGCACMNENTYKYLQNRGGNNVPFSQY
jgi:hypothetical protein